MRNTMNSSRTSMAMGLSLVFLAATLSGPALAAAREDANRGAKGTVVTEWQDHSTLPISAKTDVVVDKVLPSSISKPGASGPWKHTLVGLAYLFNAGIRF